MKRRVMMGKKEKEQGLVGDFIYGKGLSIDGELVSYPDRLVTPFIPIPDNCRKIEFYGAFNTGAVDSNEVVIDGFLIEYNSNFSMSAHDSYWGNIDFYGGRTVDIHKFGITKYIRFTIQKDRLKYAYLKDLTNSNVLFNGEDFV